MATSVVTGAIKNGEELRLSGLDVEVDREVSEAE
jgi:hypothetical protein